MKVSTRLMDEWTPKATTTHQDHVIAHVIGATVLGFFIHDQALYLLLDIGFIWTIYVDGEMALLPHPVATSELEIDEGVRVEIRSEIDRLLADGWSTEGLLRLTLAPVECIIRDVSLYTNNDQRQLILTGEDANMVVGTSVTTGEITVMSEA